jgi:hypothetical protein
MYCDNDEEGEGKRWTIVEDEKNDPPTVLNSKLKRFWEDGDDTKTVPVQQWEDRTNWVRMSQGSAGVKQGEPRSTVGPGQDPTNPAT